MREKQQAGSTGTLDINLSLVIGFRLTRGSPDDVYRFHMPVGRDRITQQSGVAFFLKVNPNHSIKLKTQVHRIAN